MTDPAVKMLADMRRKANRPHGAGEWVYLDAPLTSASWNATAYSTTAKTLIDLSVVFNVPEGVRAVYVRLFTNDSGSAAGSAYLGVGPTNVAGDLMLVSRCSGRANDARDDVSGVCKCDSNGDIYYQIAATGALTLDASMQIWGYRY